MKVMDKAVLVSRKKLPRAQTHREILQGLDHPFLPTLYAHFDTERFLFLVMEFCPGGDLHTVRQRQPEKCFSEHAAFGWTDIIVIFWMDCKEICSALAEKVSRKLQLLDPAHDVDYVLLLNVYGVTGSWTEKARTRSLMKTNKISKDPGYSLV